MSEEYRAYYHSPIGWIRITGSEEGIQSVYFVEDEEATAGEIPVCLQECVRQLDEYFQGQRRAFSLKLLPRGSNFQQRVWAQLLKVPYGRTASYRDIALALGDADAVRAVGSANGKNPIAIIIPCHRIIGSDGKLIGYGGGVWRKEWLLRHERSVLV